MSQFELLQTTSQYNSTARNRLKANYKQILKDHNIKPAEIIDMGYATNNVYSWTNVKANNIPMFEQALKIATHFNFDIKEFLK